MSKAEERGKRHFSGGQLSEAEAEENKEAQLPAEANIRWISTRKASAAADSIARNLLNSFVLHEMVVDVRAPCMS